MKMIKRNKHRLLYGRSLDLIFENKCLQKTSWIMLNKTIVTNLRITIAL